MLRHIIAPNTPQNMARLKKLAHQGAYVEETYNNTKSLVLTRDRHAIMSYSTEAYELLAGNLTTAEMLKPTKIKLRAHNE